MSKLKELIKEANQIHEMRWKVLAFDPEQDNKLVHTSDTFDCINGATKCKMDWKEKHPTHIIEIVAESIQKNEDVDAGDIAYLDDGREVEILDKLGKKYKVRSTAGSKHVFFVDDYRIAVKESAQKNEADAKSVVAGMTKDQAKELYDKLNEWGLNSFDIKDRTALLKEIDNKFHFSKQKNEDTYKVVVRDVNGSNAIIKDAKDINQAKRLKVDLTNKYKHSPVYIIKNGEVLNESSQKNEAHSLRDLNLELADDTNALSAAADKIRQRFEYRTLQNQSYTPEQAEKIYLELRRVLQKARKDVEALWNKIG